MESIVKLRQRLIRLINLGETNEIHEQIEEFVRRLFNKNLSIENFIVELQRLLNVKIKTNLINFLRQTMPLAEEFLRENHFDGESWQIFRSISIPLPKIRSSTNVFRSKFIFRFAQNQFDLDENAENLIFQIFFRFVKNLLERIFFYVRHRIDREIFHSNRYETTTNSREQIRFLIDSAKTNLTTNDDEFRRRDRDETTSFIQRETRSKHSKTSTTRLLRATRHDLIVVMENQAKLKRSKTLLFAYANR